MSKSEQEFSESSNLESPQPQESPYSSPSQQVPHLASAFSGITCDDVTMHVDANGAHLRIVEQPQAYFRFRYKSELVGTHGCLLGKSTAANKPRTHPTVELMNYTGEARIRVRVVQADKDEDHPHTLSEEEHEEDRDVSTLVPQHGSYKVGFAGMGIIHTAKKDVPGLLYKKYIDTDKFRIVNFSHKELKMYCENAAKNINLNIVRLRFSAHELATDKEICAPVFSEPIHNMKSAATNDLKICRISRYHGRARGGDDVFILVEKVNRKNIAIRFFELDDQGEEVWCANGNFLQSDVHHQYAIVFRTPPYRDQQIAKDVKVYIELVRPTDGRTSEPKEFIYKADQVFKQNKRKRMLSSYNSSESFSSGSSNKSLGEVPATVEMIDQSDRDGISNIPVYQITIPHLPVAQPTAELSLGDALYYNTGVGMPPAPLAHAAAGAVGPMLGAPNVPDPPVISLNSAELARLIQGDNLPEDEKKKFCDTDWSEYMAVIRSMNESIPDKTQNSMDFLRAMNLVTDSGRGQPEIKKEPVSPPPTPNSSSNTGEEKKQKIADKAKTNEGYQAFYTNDDGNEVKKLVKEICEMIKNKKVGCNKQLIRTKLERLFEMRLNNGDTFLHMALSTKQPSLEYIVKLVHSMRMPQLLNLANNYQQTILHQAVINEMYSIIPFLISKGCDPTVGDEEGNNVVHYAVICGGGALTPLLDAVKQYEVACDLNAYNNERQTALHLAAVYNSELSASVLLQHGASAHARDGCGRTPLHLAACDASLAAARALIQLMPSSEIDSTDGAGNTALQILCAGADHGVCADRRELVAMLLNKQADPLKHEASNISAWRLARNMPDLKQLFLERCGGALPEDDVKSEPEDEFESADEGETEMGLSELPMYINQVSSILDARGSWRELAKRLHVDSLLSWYGNTKSPSHTLLMHLKESGDNLSSKSLMLQLLDMGEVEAADVIRHLIE